MSCLNLEESLLLDSEVEVEDAISILSAFGWASNF